MFAVILAPATAMADWPERPITFIVPYGPGGGFDIYVRKIAPEMEQILGVEVVVQNLPGAGSQRGATAVYKSEPDGYTIGIWNLPGIALATSTGDSRGFDLLDVTWLAELSTSTMALGVAADSEINSLSDLCNGSSEPRLATTGATSTSAVATRVALGLANCPHVAVHGYDGSNDAILGVMRGDVAGIITPADTLAKFVRSGDIRLVLTLEDMASIQGVQSSGEFGVPGLQNLSIRRVIGGPPGMPAEIANRLSDAIVQSASSPAVKAWSAETGRPLSPAGRDQATSTVLGSLAFLKETGETSGSE
jgi:tripartite-type tricarboxylate transporter receptor subunit TctC